MTIDTLAYLTASIGLFGCACTWIAIAHDCGIARYARPWSFLAGCGACGILGFEVCLLLLLKGAR